MLLVSFCLVNNLWVQLSPGSEIQWWIRKGFLGEGGGGGCWVSSQAHRTQRWLAAYCHESATSFSVTIYRYVEIEYFYNYIKYTSQILLIL
jgi:hypothetical protein